MDWGSRVTARGGKYQGSGAGGKVCLEFTPSTTLYQSNRQELGKMPVGQVIKFDAARSAPESLQPLLDIVAGDMEAINRIILDKAVSDVELIPELAHDLIA